MVVVQLAYLCAPLQHLVPYDFDVLELCFAHLTTEDQRVAALIGVDQRFVAKARTCRPRLEHDVVHRRYTRIRTHIRAGEDAEEGSRFLLARLLCRIVEEQTLVGISGAFSQRISVGALQQLQSSAASLAATLSVFCGALRWPHLSLLLLQFSARLSFGCRPELLPLLRLEGVTACRARALYRAGLSSTEALAAAGPARIANVLRSTATPAAAAGGAAAAARIHTAALVALASSGAASGASETFIDEI